MLSLRLARIALAAEGLRLRRQIRRAFIRATLGMVAVMLFLGAIVFGHVGAWYWLRDSLPAYKVALLFVVVDFVLGFIFIAVALYSGPGRAEREARVVRDRAMEEAVESLTLTAVLIRLVEVFMTQRARE